MKKILLIFGLLACMFSAQSQVVTTTVTITNSSGTVNGNTISLNGNLRLFTNTVTSIPTQILITNSIGGVASNLYVSYFSAAAPQIHVFRLGTNAIIFQSFSGYPATVTIGGGWAAVSSVTTPLTNLMVFRGSASAVPLNERTNTANGIDSYLTDAAQTNVIPTNATLLSLFAHADSLVAVSNLAQTYSTAGSNYTVATSNSLAASLPAYTNTLNQTIKSFISTAGNTSTTDTDANSFTVPANTFASNGYTLTRTIGLICAANTNSKSVKVLFNGVTIMAATGITNVSGNVFVRAQVTRSSSTTYLYTGTGASSTSTNGLAGAAYAWAGATNAADMTASMVFKLVLTGGATSDITAVTDRIELSPSTN